MAIEITPQREHFARLVAEGASLSDAYRTAFPRSAHWKSKTVHEHASRLMANATVADRVAALQAELAADALWTRRQSREVLIGVAKQAEKDGDRVRAVIELNRMHGYHAPEKVELGARDDRPMRIEIVGGKPGGKREK